MLKIIIVKDNDKVNYYIKSNTHEATLADITDKEFVESLKGVEIKDASYIDNTDNIVLKVRKRTFKKKIDMELVFYNYSNLYGTYIYNQFNDYIHEALMYNEKVKNILLSIGKRITIGAACVTALLGGVKLYTNGHFKQIDDNTSSILVDDSSSYDDFSSIIDSSSVLDNIETSSVDNTSSNEEVSEIDDEKEKRDEDLKVISSNFLLYASYFNYDAETSRMLYANNLNRISNSTNKDYEMMQILYEYYTDNLYGQLPVTINNISNDEQCRTILKYADMLGVTDHEILYTMLAVHNLETGWGESDLCINSNNFGGNIYDTDFQVYPTYEVGAYDFVCDFMRIYKNTYTGNNSIEYDMNPVYCTENVEGNDVPWYVWISEIKDILKDRDELNRLYEPENKVKSF